MACTYRISYGSAKIKQWLTINLSPTHIIAQDASSRIDDCPSIKRWKIRWLKGRIREILAPFIDVVSRKCRDDGSHQFPIG